MEDNNNRRQPQFKTSSKEDNLNGRQPQWKMTSMEEDLNKRRLDYYVYFSSTDMDNISK